jgi:hypothetical protein
MRYLDAFGLPFNLFNRILTLRICKGIDTGSGG